MSELFGVIIYFTAMALIWIIVSYLIFFGIEESYGQEIDPRYYCLYENQYPYSELCNQQRINDTMNQLLERAREYNRDK